MSDPPLLDWRDSRHWGKTETACRHCHRPTFLRDDDRLPAHKVCAEKHAADLAARSIDRYEQGRTL